MAAWVSPSLVALLTDPSADRVARWRTQMTPEQRDEFETIAGDLLAQLGYPIGPNAVDEATQQIEAAS